MRGKTFKLVLATAILAGCLGMGAAPRAAQAIGCQPICCDPDCLSVRQCFGRPGNCICQDFCTFQ